jgi:serine/threonine-protein kinase
MPGPPAAPVDMDWDDEDEKTTVFDRGNDDAARALLRSAPPPPNFGTPLPPAYPGSPTMPPGRMPPNARLPGASPHHATVPRAVPRPLPAASPASVTPPSRVSASPFPEPKASGSGKPVLIAILSLLVVGLGAAFAILFLPKTGNAVITVAGPGNKPISGFQVSLNGKERCSASPCRVEDLESGTHLVKVTAPGYQPTAEQAIKVEAGEDAVLHLTLAQASEGTGISVNAEGSGLVLYVGDREIGPLPAQVQDLTPGQHTIRVVDKSQRYEDYEQRVTVAAEEMLKIEPRLKVKKGLAVIRAGTNADDARVLLVSGNERRPIPNLPIKIDIATDKPYSLVATRKGFEEFKQDITFEDGQAEKTFMISLVPETEQVAGEATTDDGDKAAADKEKADKIAADKAAADKEKADKIAADKAKAQELARVKAAARAAAAQARVAARPRPAPPPRRSAPVETSEPSGATESIGNGTLNLISSPPSTVVLDGKPLGMTPKTGISVSPGPHTLLFVHPDFGRKARTVTVQSGKTSSASVTFP